MKARKAWSLAILGSLLPSALATVARAQPATRTAVIVVEGGGGDAVASLIAAHIDAPHTVRDAHPFLAALAARGTRALAPAVDNRTLDAQLVARVHAAAIDAHVDVAILLAHRKGRQAVRGHLWILDAHAERALLVDQDLASTTTTDEADEVWTAAASLFPAAPKETPSKATAASPAEHDVTAEPSAPPPAETAQPTLQKASEHPTRRTAFVVIQASVEAGSRHVSYVDRITASLRSYDLFAAPLASIATEVYPLARTRLSALITGLGVTGDYARVFALSSADAGGTRVGTHWQSFDLGLRDRIELDPRWLVLGVNVGFGAIDFNFDQPGFAAVLPSVGYRFLRAGLDLRGARGDLAIFGGGGYLGVLSSGKMGGVFPRESVGGIEARIGAAYLVASGFELSLGIGYTRFFYSMHPVPGDANVAGGALDEMARLSLSLAYLL